MWESRAEGLPENQSLTQGLRGVVYTAVSLAGEATLQGGNFQPSSFPGIWWREEVATGNRTSLEKLGF